MSSHDALRSREQLQEVSIGLSLTASELRRIGLDDLSFKLEVYAKHIDRNADLLFEILVSKEVALEELEKKKEGS